ncbi:MAG TPA: AAA family ATPase [Candidatus Saccharimonadales bacterium]|nr:AAA family ATPase [Candidatus Saccharimonadales bacterium]
MLDELVLHPLTAKQLTQYAANPAHALLIAGPVGSGKGTLAQILAKHILGSTVSDVNNAAVRRIEADEKSTISIEAIRELRQFVRLKTTGTKEIRRAIIVEHADGMTTEAQNSFLKLLEEPPRDTIILVTVNTIGSLLPTIRSRVQTITVQTPTQEAVTAFFGPIHNAKTVTQSYFLSGGLPGLMQALLTSDTKHPLMQSVTEAKEILQQPPHDRLLHIEGLSKQKENALSVFEAMARMAQAGLQQAGKKQDQKRLEQWHKINKAVFAAQQQLAQNANLKLTLTNLLLHL